MLELLFILILVIGFLLLFTSNSRRREHENYLRYINYYRRSLPPEYMNGYETQPFYHSETYNTIGEHRIYSVASFLLLLLFLCFLTATFSKKSIVDVRKDKTEKVKDS